MSGTPLRIATRRSALALWQAEHVAARLRALQPGLEVALVPLSTRGDEILDRSLAAIGGKGLFLKELEVAMVEGRADCAVHSLKDVPMALDAPFALAAVLERADPFDAFVSPRYDTIESLPEGARVGTASLRRQAQLRARRPDLQLLDVRGNLNTRLARLDAGEYDALVLACAGLQRLGFGERIRERLGMPGFVPAVAQGALAIECRAGDEATQALFQPMADAATTRQVAAERAMNQALHGSCHVPVAGYCTQEGGQLSLTGLVGDAATGELVRAEATGSADDPQALGEHVARLLLERGAGRILANLDAH